MISKKKERLFDRIFFIVLFLYSIFYQIKVFFFFGFFFSLYFSLKLKKFFMFIDEKKNICLYFLPKMSYQPV
ncbi:hypothetical protein GLOIN_2v1683833 [Rhizophagus irregularis DAOM 181602=DAOM 197198]|nr:hypothetical protein GLOIN_2v1683833 [Rhizophagus irregularis DAOM 181602=DAOM 197198]